jgi:hypothetical protein
MYEFQFKPNIILIVSKIDQKALSSLILHVSQDRQCAKTGNEICTVLYGNECFGDNYSRRRGKS